MNNNLRRQILDTAKALFMRYGYEKVSLRQIAQSIGLHPTQIYRLKLPKVNILAEIIIELNAEQIRLQPELCARVTGDTVFERVYGYLLELYRLDITYLPIRSAGAAYGWMWNDYYEAKITAQVFDLVAPIINYLSKGGVNDIEGRCYAIWSLYYVGYRRAVISAGTAEECLAEIKPSLRRALQESHKQLQENMELLQKITSRVPGMVYQFKLSADGHFSVPYCSNGIIDIFRLTPKEMCEDVTKLFNRVHPNDYARFMASIYESAQKLQPWFCEFRVQFDDGVVLWLEGNATITQQPDSSVLWHGFITDITERKQTETELRIAATVFELQEGICITDINGVIIKVNQAFTTITGYSEAEVIGKKPSLLHSGRHDKVFYTAIWQSIYNKGIWQGEIWNRRKNGEIYPEWLTITAVKTDNDNAITHYVATLTDITKRKAAEETINQLAFYDPLTKLANRRLLHERIKHSIEVNHRNGKQMALLMMDLDKFKAVNDTLGHAAGDELLQQVAERINSRLRKVDTVARLGGDEFVILIENINDYEQIAHIAKALIDTLSQPFTLHQTHEVAIGASIGIAIHPIHGDSEEALTDNADHALYRAKAQGGGCFVYFSNESPQKSSSQFIC